MEIERFDQLDAWKKGHLMVLRVYHLTAAFPAEDKYGLVEGMRRTALSIPVQIAEGFNRGEPGNKLHFYKAARGAVEELRYYFILCADLGFNGVETMHLEKCDEIAEMLRELIQGVGT